MPGVEIGNNVIVGAGSVGCKSVQNDCVVAGQPAKNICSLEEYKPKLENRMDLSLG